MPRCMSCLYTLDIKSLLVISFANIFSHFIRLSFHLSMVFFAVQKLLHLIRSWVCFFCFFFFAFVSFTLGDGSKKIVLQFMSKSVLPTWSSRSFIVSCLTFQSLIHFEFIFYVLLENVLIWFFYVYLGHLVFLRLEKWLNC